MLIITRKAGEKFVIRDTTGSGQSITIWWDKKSDHSIGSEINFYFDGPRHIQVDRPDAKKPGKEAEHGRPDHPAV